MSKYKAIMLAMFAVFAFSAIAASSAMAEEWQHEGKPITSALPGLIDGKLVLVHTGGLLGNATIKCTGQFHGTFGPGSKDTITEVLGLSGEKNPIKCEFTAGACGVGSAASVKAVHLPWATKLELPAGTTLGGVWDEISSSGAGTPGYETECVSLKVKITCEHNARSHFESNGTSGAILKFHGKESEEASCSDGGKGTIEEGGEALGFTIS